METVMLKLTLLILSLFVFNCLVAQEKAIKIFNEQKSKEIIIKENKRIRVQTYDGLKISGRFKIIDNETIRVKYKKINLSEIYNIKRNPLVMSILIDGTFYYFGTIFFVGSLALYGLTGGEEASLFLMIPSAALIYGGIKSPNILKSHTTSNWQYEIITITKPE